MCIFQNLEIITECDLSPFCKLAEDTQSIEPYYDEIVDEDCNNTNKTDKNSNNNSKIVDFLNKELEYEIYYDNEVRLFCQTTENQRFENVMKCEFENIFWSYWMNQKENVLCNKPRVVVIRGN